jgi:hypothetical protein
MPIVVSGLRDIDNPGSPATPELTQERYLDCFCPQCWSFENFRHNKDTVRDWSFMRDPIEKGKKIGQNTNPSSLRGPLTESEMQKVVNFYLKMGKAPGPDKIQAELVKTMPPEQLRVIRIWLNEVLAEGIPLTKVTEKEMTGRLALLHKGGSKADMSSHWRPVVLLNCTNQLVAYIINERLTEMVENAHILSQAQGGFRQNKSTDINGCKLYGITNEAQRLKKRFLRVDICKNIDFKSAFNSMSQASLWAILEAYDIPDVDLLKSFYEHTTVRLPQTKVGSAKITFNTGVAQGSVLLPLLFSLFINALSRYLDDIGSREKINHGLPNIAPFCHILFADDMTLLAQTEAKMQQLMDAVQDFLGFFPR